MKKYILLLYLVFLASFSHSQTDKQHKLDSLNLILSTSPLGDTITAIALYEIADLSVSDNIDTVIPLCQKSIKILVGIQKESKNKYLTNRIKYHLATAYNLIGYVKIVKDEQDEALQIFEKSIQYAVQSNNLKDQATALNNSAYIYDKRGENDKALELYEKSLNIREQLDEKKDIANSLNNIGALYNAIGDVSLALEYYNRALRIQEKIGDFKNLAITINNIGYIYNNNEEVDKALKYYHRAAEIQDSIRDFNYLPVSLNNIAGVYKKLNKKQLALEYYHKSLKIYEEIGSKLGKSLVYNNIGQIYHHENKYEEALEYYQRSLDYAIEINNPNRQTVTYLNIGNIYFVKNEITKSKEYIEKSLKIAQEAGYPERIRNSAGRLSIVYEADGMYKQALAMEKLFRKMNDSINNTQVKKSVAQQEARYKYEKQKIADDLEHQKAMIVEKEEREKQRYIIYSIIVGLILLVLFTAFIFNRWRITKRQKSVIEKQKLLVDQARNQLEIQNKEITDSIVYAKRIQNAILPSNKVLSSHLEDYFVFYQPKDIVAGDFYWIEKVNQTIFIAVADCTGHGVPGAMVSVVCNNGLQRSLREYQLFEPASILNKTNEIVIKEFEKSEEEIKDGMDISLCSIQANQLLFSGANNPLWVVRNNELIEIKGDKQPIGKFQFSKPFSQQSFELKHQDTVYMFTDGFRDQFGGPNGKKFLLKSFRKLILSIQSKSMLEQMNTLELTFNEWKSSGEQIDDVTVLGFRYLDSEVG